MFAGYLVVQMLARGMKVAHTNEDWRAATAAVRAANAPRPVLLSGAYTESRNLAWVEDPKHAAYMGAPLAYYPAGGPATVLPLFVGPDAEAYVERMLQAPALQNGFALVERSSKLPSWAPWLVARGYRTRKIWSEGNPSAWVVERSP